MPEDAKPQEQPTNEQAGTESQTPASKKPARKRPARPLAGVPAGAEQPTGPGAPILLFGKYGYDVNVRDLSLRNYINLRAIEYPETFRKGSQKRLSKSNLNIVERLANNLMRGGTGGKVGGKVIRTKGRLQGKKYKVLRIIEDAFDQVNKQTGDNPVQVLVYALENSAPIEDTTRVRYGGVISNIPVDVSASRRLDIALRNVAMAAVIGAFGSKRTVVDTLANELVLASRNDVNSYSIKRKNEIERMARSAK